MEEWADLNNFPNHQISSYGRIRNKKTNHILKPFSDRYGYLRGCLAGVRKGQRFHGCHIEYVKNKE